MIIPNNVSAIDHENYEYTTDGTAITITGYNGAGGALKIPSTINGLPVTTIGEEAFLYAPIVTLEISDGIQIIENEAFYGCSGMISVILPSTIEEIGEKAFYLCIDLVTINLNEGLTTLGDSAFAYCSRLGGTSTITIPSTLSIIPDFAFYNCTALVNLIISDGVTDIGESAFSEADSLHTIYIPGSVHTIGVSAFYDDDSLVNVIIGNGTHVIGNHAFEYCDALLRFRMSQTVQSIGEHAFEYCTALTEISFNSGVTSLGHFCLAYSGVLTINMQMLAPPTNGGSWMDGVGGSPVVKAFPYSTFSFAPGTWYGITLVNTLANFTYSGDQIMQYLGKNNSVTLSGYRWIWEYAFYGNTDIINIDTQGMLTPWAFRWSCFEYCTNLVHFHFGSGMSSMHATGRQFFACSSLSSIEYETGTYSNNIPVGMFQYSGLTNVTYLPASYLTINEAAFYGCPELVSIALPVNLSTLGYVAFAECPKLEEINIPDTVLTVGEASFFNCISLWNVTINSGTTKIGSWAFQNCESLVDMVIPDSVTEIDDFAFEFCTALSSIDLGAGLVRLGYSVFHGCSALVNIFLPTSLEQLGDNLTTLTAGVFDQCTELLNINIHINNTEFTSIGGAIFSKDGKTLIQYPAGRGGAYVIPSYATSIMPGAFYYCIHLTSVTVPSGITVINYATFASCDELITINLPNTLLTIADSAFQICPKLNNVVIPNSVTDIGNESFYFCTGLTTVTIGNQVTQIGELAFYACSSLLTVTIPDSVYLLDNYSFMFCSSLTVVRIGQGIAWIGQAAFMNCESLVEIYFYSAAPPTIDILWIENTNIALVGYASNTSSFPAPGSMLYTDYYWYEEANYDAPTGLLMGAYFVPVPPAPAVVSILSNLAWLLVFFIPVLICGAYLGMTGIVVGTGIMSLVIGLTQTDGYLIMAVGLTVTLIYMLNLGRDGD
jgi:hypothetical protein